MPSYVGLMQCFYCGEAAGVALDKRLRDSLPDGQAVYDMQPCSKCAEYMRQGVILLGVKDDTEFDRIAAERKAWQAAQDRKPERQRAPFIPNPFRSGDFLVVSEAWVRRAIHPRELREQILTCRWTFISQATIKWLQQQLEPSPQESTDG